MKCIVFDCLSQEEMVKFSYTLGDGQYREGQACPVHARLIYDSPGHYSIGPFKVDKTHLE